MAVTCPRSQSNSVEELDPDSRFPDAEQKGRVQLVRQLINNLQDLPGASVLNGSRAVLCFEVSSRESLGGKQAPEVGLVAFCNCSLCYF